MSNILKSFLKPRSLTECVFEPSLSGALKGKLWSLMNLNRVRAHRNFIKLDDQEKSVASELRNNGITINDVSNCLSSHGLAVLKESEVFVRQCVASDEVQAIIAKGQSEEKNKNYLIHLVDFHNVIKTDNPLLKLALDERLLKIVADYMGLVPQLHAIGSWYNFPVDQNMTASQLWHRDPEDLKTVKVFIYLDDVGPKQGPFTYIPKSHPFGEECTRTPVHQHPRRVLDDEMQNTFPKSQWLECLGKAGTMIIADTVGFHRGGYVNEGHRLLITFTYTSGVPQEPRKLKLSGELPWTPSPVQAYAFH